MYFFLSFRLRRLVPTTADLSYISFLTINCEANFGRWPCNLIEKKKKFEPKLFVEKNQSQHNLLIVCSPDYEFRTSI